MSGRCAHYDLRPKACKSLEAASSLCLLSRLWAHLDLQWFSAAQRSAPVRGQFGEFLAKVHFRGDSIFIENIDGFGDENSKAAIDEYNQSLPEER